MYQFIPHRDIRPRSVTRTPSAAKASTPQGRLAALGAVNAPKGMDAFTQGDGKGTKGKASARDVINEALRNDDHCNHVEAPQSPTYLVGDLGDMLTLLPEIERKAAAEKSVPARRHARTCTCCWPALRRTRERLPTPTPRGTSAGSKPR